LNLTLFNVLEDKDIDNFILDWHDEKTPLKKTFNFNLTQ
jgi:hypothetical protein